MSVNTSLSKDLPNMYATLADTKATYNGNDIDVFFEEDFNIDGVSDRVIKAQTINVAAMVTGESILLDLETYKVINFNPTKDKLETIIALNKVTS